MCIIILGYYKINSSKSYAQYTSHPGNDTLASSIISYSSDIFCLLFHNGY